MNDLPISEPCYGILKRHTTETPLDRAVEELTRFGYAIVDGGYTTKELDLFSKVFVETHHQYCELYGAERLAALDEYNGIRLPLALNEQFSRLATNKAVLDVVSTLICGRILLNQQNGVINPAGERYNQGAWHRDLPYQHFVSSRPIIINALFCIDDFTENNGATWVIPGSHLMEQFPSKEFVERHCLQAVAPRGSFVILDGMTFHRGGINFSTKARRAVNHVYTIPHIKQQIDIEAILGERITDPDLRKLLGYGYSVPRSVEDFLNTRNSQNKS